MPVPDGVFRPYRQEMSARFSAAIRPASLADVSVLANLGAVTFVEAFGHLYSSADLSAFLSAARSEAFYAALLNDTRLFIALAYPKSTNVPVGYCVAGPCKLPVQDLEPEAGEIRELYVLADFQKHQVGTQLLATALDWLHTRRFWPVYVGVWAENLGAQRFYGRFGFERVGEYDFPVGRQIDREYILKLTPSSSKVMVPSR